MAYNETENGDSLCTDEGVVNYGSLLHSHGTVQYVVPLALQSLPAIILLIGMFISSETPRWLARKDRWDEAAKVLARVRGLPQTHPYVQDELQEMADQLAYERRLIAGSGIVDLLKEMFTVPGNRKRALISIGLMICQQMTGESRQSLRSDSGMTDVQSRNERNQLLRTSDLHQSRSHRHCTLTLRDRYLWRPEDGRLCALPAPGR